MKRVILQQLDIENFKGINSCSFQFGKVFTSVKGANGTGKTTLLDAYLWVLTGKDSNGSESFKVQPVDEHNVTIPKIVTKVEVKLSIDGVDITFARQLSQKWSKPRGTNEETLKGNESTYYVDGVPMTQGEYYLKVKEQLCNTDDFKLMSSITHFFGLSVNDKRRKLMEMAGEMPDILTEEAFPNLYRRFQVVKSIEGVKRSASLALTELNKRMAEIPSKMSENERNMPNGIDFEALRKEEKEISSRIEDIDAQLQVDLSAKSKKFEKIEAIRKRRFEINSRIASILERYRDEASSFMSKYESELKKMENELRDGQTKLNTAKIRLTSSEKNVAVYTDKVNDLAAQWRKVNEEKFDGTVDEACPVCKRPFSKEEIADAMNELVKAFNKGKVAKLEAIVKLGNNAREVLDNEKKLMEQYRSDVAVNTALIDELSLKIDEYRRSIPTVPDFKCDARKDEEYIALNAELEDTSKMIDSLVDTESSSNDDLKNEKTGLSIRLRSVISELAKENMITVVSERREQLKEEAKKIAVEVAEQEQILYEVKKYTKSHITMVEDKVSSMFSMVRFQMYEPNITNDGEKEICECLVDGVPYSSNLNSASKVNAGIDVVNAISDWKKIYVPLFIDNKETVTNIIPSHTQVITLEVSDGNLRIS